ncbi:SDR family oxidoreductase [Halobacillus mangrovi]|uniref:SDR family oxidoreductase n=1 Tax=Halobacillus mangrovi TaxID=402384 RepID=UPI003D98D57B
MKLLLTGATGFVGKQLTLRLLNEGHEVYALARNERKAEKLLDAVPKELQSNLFIINGDISKKQAGVSDEKIKELKNHIDTVYHIAAFLSFDEEDRELTFKVNVDGTRNILEFAKEIGVKNFFHVSTAYTLGDKLYGKEELHSVHNTFVNSYEESKCYAEHLVFEYTDHFNVNIFRPSIIVGDSKTGEAESTFALYGVIRSFEILKKRMSRQKQESNHNIRFLCESEAAQNLVPVDYVVDVLTAGLEHAEKGTIYHMTNSNPPTNQFVFETLKEELDFHKVELVPISYANQLTEQELKFNEPMRVFHRYLEKTLTFDDSNTRELLKKSHMEPLHMDKTMLKTIINGKCMN